MDVNYSICGSFSYFNCYFFVSFIYCVNTHFDEIRTHLVLGNEHEKIFLKINPLLTMKWKYSKYVEKNEPTTKYATFENSNSHNTVSTWE